MATGDKLVTLDGLKAVYDKVDGDVGGLKSAVKYDEYASLSFSVAGTGFIHVSDGMVRSSSTSSYTNYIDVSSFYSIKYKRQGYTASTVTPGIAFYDSSKNYIANSSIAGANSQTADGYCSVLYETKVPATAYYVRFTIYTDTTTYGQFELYGISNVPRIVGEMDSVREKTFPSTLVPFAKTRSKVGAITDGYFNGYIHGLYYNIYYNQLVGALKRLITGNGELIGGTNEIATAIANADNYTLHLTPGMYEIELNLLKGTFNNSSDTAQPTMRFLFYDKTSKTERMVAACAFNAGYSISGGNTYKWRVFCTHDDDYALVTEFHAELYGRVGISDPNCEFYYSVNKIPMDDITTESLLDNTFTSMLTPYSKTRESTGAITSGYFNGHIHGLYYNIYYNALTGALRRLVTGSGELISGTDNIAAALNIDSNYTVHLSPGVYEIKLTMLSGSFSNTSGSSQPTLRMLFYDKTSKSQKIIAPCAISSGYTIASGEQYSWEIYADYEDDYAIVTEFQGQLFGRVASGEPNCEFYYSIERQPEKSLSAARRNVQAAARQLTDITWTTIQPMPFGNNDMYLPAGSTQKGIPYSSTRSNCKYVGQHVSLYTFMSALQNPRSVLYTRIMNIGTPQLCTTYYGLTCFTFTSYSCGRGLGKWDNAIASKYNGEDIEISPYDIQPGDTLECMIDRETIPEPASSRPGMHTMLIYDVIRDNYGRITRVVLAEGNIPTARINAPITFSEFLNDYVYNSPSYNYRVYRKAQNDFGAYESVDVVKGYPDEELPTIVYPDIMPEYGDKACVEAGEDVVINVINARSYNAIKIYKNDTLIDTKTTIADFTMIAMTYGTYKFVITDGTNSSESTLIVADVNATYDSTTKVLTFSSANATPMFAASYRVGEGSMNGAQNKVKYFTKAERQNGTASMEGVVGQYYSEVQVGFLTDYGVAMWWSNKIPNQWIPWTPPT